MHDFDGIIGIFLTLELHKSVPLMFVGDFVTRNVHIDDRSALSEEFPEYVFVDFLIYVSSVNCCLLVAFVERGDCRHALIILSSIIKVLIFFKKMKLMS